MPPRARPTGTRRKQSTATRAFLFSDLRDYTSYVEAKGDAAAARLLREYRTLVRREVAQHEGAEVKTEGDSFYVVFERPSAALDCAVALLRAAEVRNSKDPTAPLKIGVGLHAGETVEYDDQFVGSAVNIASRLAGRAGAMELLISDTLRGLVRTSQALPMTDRGPLDLKGVAEPIRAWSVGWQESVDEPKAPPPAQAVIASAPAAAPAAGQLLCPVVVGRAAETARFDAALAAAIAGAGQTVAVGGEAGVGKSKFVREAQEHATARGARVLIGLTHQSDTTLPYAPFVSAIRSGFHGLDREELSRVLQRSAPDLAELFPELGRIERATSPTGIERHRLSVAFQHLFRAFARETPVLVVLEDLHWADETSLELLQHLARELRDARVLILATYRSDEMHRRHPFLRTLAELQRERLVTEIQLKRLTPDETRELIRATMATRDPNVRVSEEFRDAIYSRTDGNPFFTEELLKALVDSGGVFLQESGWARKPLAELAIPGSIREAVRARVEQLSAEARETLSAAAVIGLRFGFDLLREVSAVDERTLEAQLREFIELQLVSEAGDDDEYAFRHALTREVVYDDLLVRERKRLHRTVAEQLARDAKTEPALLAQHLIAAGERERAVPVLLEAASRAIRADAPREAVAHYESALEVGVPDAELADVLERVADAYHLFDSARSLNAANEAAAVYRDRGDRRGLSRALRLASRNMWLRGDVAPATATAREAIDVLEGEECVESARALAHLAGFRMTQNEWDDAIAIADRAIEQAGRFQDTFALANALITKGSAIARTDPADGVALIDRGRKLALDAGLAATVLRGWNNQSLWLGMIGWTLERRLAFLREGIAWGRAHGVERGNLYWLLNSFGSFAVFAGQLHEGLAAFEEIERDGGWVGRSAHQMFLALIDGPATVRARVLEIAEQVLAIGDAGEPQRVVPGLLIAAFVLALLDDREGASSWAQRVAAKGAGVAAFREQVAGPWHNLAIATALLTGVDELVAVIARHESPAPTPDFEEMRKDAVAFGEAAIRGDTAVAGTRLGSFWSHVESFDQPFLAVPMTLAGARRFPDVAALPEWREPLAKARAFAAKSGMRWLHEAVPEPR